MTGDASMAQYGPTPAPQCVSCQPASPLPYTGSDLVVEAGAAAMLLSAGVCVAVIVRRWR